MNGILGNFNNPMTMAGLGILSANTPSLTPPNYAQSVMQNLLLGNQMQRQMTAEERQAREDEMRQKEYEIKLQEYERKVEKENKMSQWASGLDPSVDVVQIAHGLLSSGDPGLIEKGAGILATLGKQGDVPTIKEFYEGGVVKQKQYNPETSTWDLVGEGPRWSPETPQQAPAAIQEYNLYNSLPPEQREEFLRVKRAQPFLDTGAGYVAPSLTNPSAAPTPVVEKELTPDQKLAAEREAAAASGKKNLAVVPMNLLKTQVAELRDHPGLDNITGFIAGRTPTLSQEGRNAQDLLDSIKSQISTYKLQSMRDASQTGGAVGNVTEKEWPRLESALAALGQSQDTETYKRRLGEVISIIDESTKLIDEAYNMTYGGVTMPTSPTSNTTGWGIKKK